MNQGPEESIAHLIPDTARMACNDALQPFDESSSKVVDASFVLVDPCGSLLALPSACAFEQGPKPS